MFLLNCRICCLSSWILIILIARWFSASVGSPLDKNYYEPMVHSSITFITTALFFTYNCQYVTPEVFSELLMITNTYIAHMHH